MSWLSGRGLVSKDTANVSWRRPQRKRELPASSGDGALPPMPPADLDDDRATDQAAAGDGLGDSTAPEPKSRGRGKQQELETA